MSSHPLADAGPAPTFGAYPTCSPVLAHAGPVPTFGACLTHPLVLAHAGPVPTFWACPDEQYAQWRHDALGPRPSTPASMVAALFGAQPTVPTARRRSGQRSGWLGGGVGGLGMQIHKPRMQTQRAEHWVGG
jgi:hypothetical protein